MTQQLTWRDGRTGYNGEPWLQRGGMVQIASTENGVMRTRRVSIRPVRDPQARSARSLRGT
jgi:hypothetical protein